MLRTPSAPPPVTLRGSGLADSAGSPPELVIEPGDSLLSQQIKASIQTQYLLAAEQGKISKIKAWRIARGLDQETLAQRANMTQPEVSRAERLGQVGKMKGETLRRIAQALQVRIDELF